MPAKLNLRFAHFPSRAPIMLELQVDPNTTVGQLRALVEEKLATEDHCLVRVFARWYLEMRAGEVRRFSELTDADGGSVLGAVGIEDECELYLEGPVIEEENGMWKALAVVSMQGRQAQAQQASLVQSLLDEMHALKETQAMQRDEIRSLREALAKGNANQEQKLDKLAKQIEALVSAAQTKQSEDLAQTSQSGAQEKKQQLDAVDTSLLVKHSGMPLKALWEVLNDEGSSVELAMAIVMDRRCGLERRSTVADGEMKSWNGFVMNDEGGGLTPLVMAALAGRVDVMKALLAAGADKDAKEDHLGLAALHVVAIYNNPTAIDFLVSHGADVDVLSRLSGSTPLHQAAFNSQLEAIEMLIAKGADITKVNKDGETPLKRFELRENDHTKKSQKEKDRIRQLLTPIFYQRQSKKST